MGTSVGIDVGGTFTDFLFVSDDGVPRIHKTLSTPHDPSIAVITGLSELAAAMDPPVSLKDLVAGIETIVHGTTVTTNATLTRHGAKTGLITTEGVRDALEMRRGIREEQYNNRYTNVEPLVPRYLRVGLRGRLDRNGREISALNLDALDDAIALFQENDIEAVAICFMNAYANPDHEKTVAQRVRQSMPDAYLSVSSQLLPSIRFYERVSTTVLNAYIGPILDRYLSSLENRLEQEGFAGKLLIMQSNGGVTEPRTARERAASTLLSGPAAGPRASLHYAGALGQTKCIVVDMGGTSFEASLVVDRPLMASTGEIDRFRLALPMLDINTIGAGGGSIGWIDNGGLLQMGPQSAGAAPGPACYGKGGKKPTTTDANVILGYLDPGYFAGGTMSLDAVAARAAIDEYVAKPLGLTVEQAAAGMYKVACTNMAEGVREVTVKRGHDPREFAMVVAGGAGAIHSSEICRELEIPMQIIPREASILCAAGMLMSDLEHDHVHTYVRRLDTLDFEDLDKIVKGIVERATLKFAADRIAEEKRSFLCTLECRYLKQYHEVGFLVPLEQIENGDREAIASAFHEQHNSLYGYSLREQGAPIEVVNVRITAIGKTDRPSFARSMRFDGNVERAKKGARSVYIPESGRFEAVQIYNGHVLGHGDLVKGPAIIEQETTAIFVSPTYNCVCDRFGSFVVFDKKRPELALLVATDEENIAEATSGDEGSVAGEDRENGSAAPDAASVTDAETGIAEEPAGVGAEEEDEDGASTGNQPDNLEADVNPAATEPSGDHTTSVEEVSEEVADEATGGETGAGGDEAGGDTIEPAKSDEDTGADDVKSGADSDDEGSEDDGPAEAVEAEAVGGAEAGREEQAEPDDAVEDSTAGDGNDGDDRPNMTSEPEVVS